MKLTCVTATFNCIKAGNREGLIRCVESVAKLRTEHEHLIYDGASTDGTVELLRELEAKTPGLKVVSEPDTGIYNALNKGVRDAKGEWFYVLGADDYICNPVVMDDIFANGNRGVQIIVTPVERDPPLGLFFNPAHDLRNIFRTVIYSHQGTVFQTRVLRELGGFDEQYKICADGDLALRAHCSGKKFKYTTIPFAHFSEGGLCTQSPMVTRREVCGFIADFFALPIGERRLFESSLTLPIFKMVPYIFSRDLTLRYSALSMVKARIKYRIKQIVRGDIGEGGNA